MKKVESYGAIKDGKLSVSHRNKFLEGISYMPDGRCRISIERLYKKRSHEQNAYYWSVIIHEFLMGYHELNGEWITSQQAHEMLKAEFCFIEMTNASTGEVKKIPKSTTELTTVEFMEYLEECIRFIAEWFGREVDPPGVQTEMKFNE